MPRGGGEEGEGEGERTPRNLDVRYIVLLAPCLKRHDDSTLQCGLGSCFSEPFSGFFSNKWTLPSLPTIWQGRGSCVTGNR